MRLLFVHERYGALGGAESNILTTAREFRRREHTVGIVHGPSTGKGEAAWNETFAPRFPLGRRNNGVRVRAALQEFQPDAIYVHKLADIEALEALFEADAPIVRMVHDHDLYCMRSYRYNYFTRRICERRASLYCVVPCGAFVKRNNEGTLPLKWVSYFDKRRELRLNHRFHRECSAVVMSSAWPEPFGAAGLEAMRYGLPVVAFDAGGIREWLIDGQNGFLVPWMDRAAFAERLEALLQDKGLARRLGEQARRMVAASYDFSKYIDALEDLLERVSERSLEGQPA